MKKVPKILMLSTAVLLSAQGVLSATEAVSANEKAVTSLTEKEVFLKFS